MKLITQTPSYIVDKNLEVDQSNWDSPQHLAIGQISMEKLFRTVELAAGCDKFEFVLANKPLDVDSMMFDDPLMTGRNINGEQLLNRRIYNDGLMVFHRGKLCHESYRNGLTATDRHVIHSCTKSFCAMLVAIAIENKLLNKNELISSYIPQLKTLSAWENVTLQHVLDMQAGVKYSEDYTDPNADYWDYARAAGYYPTKNGEPRIGVKQWIFENLLEQDCLPGTKFVYNSCLANVLGMALENVYQQDLAEIFEAQLYQRCGVECSAYFNTDPQGFPITEGQFNCRLRDFARCALLMINQGKNLAGEQIVPAQFISDLVVTDNSYQKAYQAQVKDRLFKKGQYQNQFWVVQPDQKQFCMLGIHGQFAWFDINRDLMIVGVGSYPIQDGDLMMSSLNTLWQQIAKSV